MNVNQDIHIDELNELFFYNHESGHLTWKKLVKHSKHSVGDRAGCSGKSGYRRVSVRKRLYREHRVIWAIVTGRWPTAMIDHIDGDKSNNRFENLRECSQKENCQNRIPPKNNRLVGVSFRRDVNKWQARIYVGGVNKSLGYFNSREEAHAAYAEARNKHFSFCPEIPNR